MIGLYITLFVIGFILLIGFGFAIHYHKKLFGNRWQPDGIVSYYDVNDFKGLEKKFVEFKRKNITLRGFIYSYSNSYYKGVVVFCHGMWGSHKAYLQEIERLARDGFLVLGYDALATDLSDGKKIGSLTESLISLDYAIRYVKQTYPRYDIYTMGHSWGGYATSNILKYHNDLKCVVSMSPFISVWKMFDSLLPKMFKFFMPFLMVLEFINAGKYALSNALDACQNTKCNVLVIHSKDDNMCKYDYHTKYLEDNLKNENVKFLILDNKKHHPDYAIEAIEYMDIVNKEMKRYKKHELVIYRKSLDYKLMGKLDDKIISEILLFLNGGKHE